MEHKYMDVYDNELCHHGIKGMRWGIRRYQNKDGTLTEKGRKRYGESGAQYLKAKRNYKKALRKTRGVSIAGKAAQVGFTLAGRPIAGKVVRDSIEKTRGSYGKTKSARNEYIKRRHDMLYETGRRKKLKGKYQTTGDDEVKYGYRGAKRIAKRRNKGLSREKALRPEKFRKGVKAVGTVAVAALGVYDSLTGGRVTKAILKGSIKAGVAVARGAKAVKGKYRSYYNTTILDANGRVVSRCHDGVMYGEDVVRKMLHA